MIIGVDAKTINQKQRTGIENYLIYLLQSLAKIDTKNQYWLYSPSKISAMSTKFKNRNFINKIIKFPLAWSQFGLSWEFFKNQPALDVFFSPAHSVPIYCPTKLVVTIHDLAFLDFSNYFTSRDLLRLKIITKRAVQKADKIIAISQSTKKDLLRHYHLPPEKIATIYSGYNRDLFEPAPQKVISKALKKYHINRPYLIYVGTLQKRKNLPRLISAFAILKEKHQIPHQLVIVGKKGWLFQDIFQRVKKLKISPEVVFCGFVPDSELPALLSGADLFVLPSLYEGFGFPVLEAAACATPVVVSGVSSLPEVVGNAGILVNPMKVGDISQGIYQVISNSALKTQLSQKARLQANKFSWEKSARQTLKVFEEVGSKNVK